MKFQKKHLQALLTTTFFISYLTVFSQIQITYPLNRMVFQRNATNSATIAITGYYQQGIDRVEARAVALQGGTTTNWQVIKNNPQGGWYSGLLGLVGGWYQLEVRGMLGTNVVATATVQKFGVGEVFVVAGQSNAAGQYNVGAVGAADDRVNCVNFFDTNGATSLPQPNFIHVDATTPIGPHGKSSWCWGKLGDLLASRYNVPVMFYNAAYDGTLVRNWAESADGGATLSGYANAYYGAGQPFVFMKTALNYYASMTGTRAVLWHQGESDSQLGTNPDAYQSYLKTIIAKSRQYFGNNIGWMIARVSLMNGISSSSIIAAQDQTIATTTKAYTGPNTDLVQPIRPDNIHFGGTGLIDLANAWNASLTQSFFDSCTPVLGNYPAITSSCVNNTVNLSIQGATAISWSNGASGLSLALAAGSYQAVAKDAAGNNFFIPNFTIQQGSCTVVAPCTVPAPSISGYTTSVCVGTNVTLTANCAANQTTNWSDGQKTSSITLTNTIPEQKTISVKCSAVGCTDSPETNITVVWKKIDVAIIDVAQSQRQTLTVANPTIASWRIITPSLPSDQNVPLERSTANNRTKFYTEDYGIPRFWTMEVSLCNVPTAKSVSFLLYQFNESTNTFIRSFNTVENNAPYFMFANANQYKTLYTLNDPVVGFSSSYDNNLENGFPKGKYNLKVKAMSLPGIDYGSVPSTTTRNEAGSVLAEQEFFFQIGSKLGPTTGPARIGIGSTEVVETTATKAISVYPNPVRDVLSIALNDMKDQDVTLTFTDLLGRTIIQKSLIPSTNRHNERMNISQEKTGTYFLNIMNETKKTTLKIMKSE
jgi:Carbohydrate esterase, sialic acid-specific acetylesterase/Secretion system C-terminal sorting domain